MELCLMLNSNNQLRLFSEKDHDDFELSLLIEVLDVTGAASATTNTQLV